MQRWLEDRELRVRLGVGLALLALLAAPLIFGPSLVLSRIQARAAQRGLTFEASDADLGVNGVGFDDVKVTWRDEGRALLQVGRLDVGLAWSRLSEGASAALTEVALQGARLDVSAADIVRFRRSGSPAAATTPANAGTQALPELTARDVELTLRDAAGVLVQARGLNGELSDGKFAVRVGELSLGDASGDQALIHTLTANGQMHGRHPQLTSAGSESALFTWAADRAQPRDAKDPFPVGRGRTLARLREWRGVLRGEGASPGAAAPAVSSAPANSHGNLWTDDARIDLRNMRVVETGADGGVILEGLDVSLLAAGQDALRVTGKGRAPGAGEVAWDLRLVPDEARVEGKLAVHDVSLALLGPVLPPLPFFELETTRVRADLELTGRGLESITVKGALTVRDLTFASEGLARTPVGPFTFEARGEGTWTPARRELSGIQARISTGALRMSLSGLLAWPKDGYRVDFIAELPKSQCSDVLTSVPAGLLDELATIEMGGTLGGKLTVHVDAADLDATKVDFDIKDACTFGALPPLLDLTRFQQPFLHQVQEPDGTLFEMETGPGSANWAPIEQISPFFIQAVVSHEDGRFWNHRGFAEPEIGVALARNLKAKAFRFGASTITMQLVKNVFLHRDKLLSRKVQEALIVWWLEQQWDKRRILELYLNVIEYGPALYGIRAASMHYFGALPYDLTPAQAAFLATILPSPKTSHSYYDNRGLTTSAKSRIASLLKHMHSRQRIDDEALAYGLEELDHFTFYDPTQPPPLPPVIRGKAQPPPFNVPAPAFPSWDAVPFGAQEDGSFGNN